MLPYIAEFIGTAMMILLGNGVVANVTLEKSGMKGAGPIQVTIAWGLAVMIPAIIFGNVSGAQFNPALTIALAFDHTIAWNVVPGYIFAQFAGAFMGAVLVYILYKEHFECTENVDLKFGAFATGASVQNLPRNLLSETIGTFVLVFAIKGLAQIENCSPGVEKLFIFGIIVAIGMSLGGLTGYAINPARDLGPRLAHAVLPIKGKGSSHWEYAPIVVFGPLLGAVAAVLLYGILPW